MTNATDELSRLLEERGVEYTTDDRCREFFWDTGEHGTVRASAIGTKGLVQMIVTGISPEQAVEATLGRGVCRITVHDNLAETEGNGDVWLECDACHWQMDYADAPFMPLNFCPSCGREVVE